MACHEPNDPAVPEVQPAAAPPATESIQDQAELIERLCSKAGDAVIASYQVEHQPWRKWAIIVTIIAMAASMLGALANWGFSILTGTDALGILAEQLQDAIALQVSDSMYGRMLPLKIFLQQGYETAFLAGHDLTTHEGQMAMTSQNIGFLKTYLGNTRCCTGMYTNMWYYGVDIDTGLPNASWGQANEDNYGDDRAQFTILVAQPSGDPTWLIHGLYPEGSRTNPTVKEDCDPITGRPLSPSRYPYGVAVDPSIGNRETWGFQHWVKDDGFWYQTVLQKQMKEGDFALSKVFMWSINKPVTLKTHGIIPIYHPSCGVDSSRCPGVVQRLVGAWVVGFKLHFFSQYLSELELKDGFIFYVERETGNFLACSDKSLDVFRTTEDADGGKSYTPYKADAADFPDERVKTRIDWLLNKQEGGPVTWATVNPAKGLVEIGGSSEFVAVYSFKEFGVDWIGVMTIPHASVMADINAAKYKTLALGMLVVVCIKGALMLLNAFLTWKAKLVFVFPALRRQVGAAIARELREEKAPESHIRVAAAAAAGGVAGAAAATAAVAIGA